MKPVTDSTALQNMTKEVETRIVRTACPAHCGGDACGILAHVRDGRVIKVEPATFPDPKYRRICLRGLASLELTYHNDRLKYPMRRVGERGEGKFERISWDEALDTIAARFGDIAARYGWQALGWVLGGPGTGTTKFGAYLRLASLTQSTRVSSWGYGDSALPCGSRALFGTHTPFELLSGGESPRLLILWGANPAETAPLTRMRRVMDVKEKGARVVVIDPRFTVTASKADQYIGIKPGTDTALALGIMNVIFRRGLQDEDFIRRYTVGPFLVRTDDGAFLRETALNPGGSNQCVVWDNNSNSARVSDTPGVTPALTGTYHVSGVECKPAFQLLVEMVEAYPLELVSELTGVKAELITGLAERLVAEKPVSILPYLGFTRTFYGDLAMRAVGTLAAVTGNVRLGPTAGHRPVVLNWAPFLHTDPNKPTFSRLGILQLYEAVISGKPFPVKTVWFAFINFLNQCVDSNKIAREVFPNLEFIVVADLFMTPTARYADILLPACSYLEFSDLVIGPGPYLQLQQKVIEPLYESRSDVAIATELAHRMGLGDHFDKGEEGFIDLLLASGHPSVNGITVAKLKQGPMLTHPPEAVSTDSEVKLSTPSGKIELYVEQLSQYGQALPVYLEPLEARPERTRGKYPLSYIQGHSRFRTHSMFANAATLLELNPEPVVEINPRDAEIRKITDGDMVTVLNDRGRVTLKARLTEGISPGVVNISEGWWPNQFEEGDGNALTHDAINPVQEILFEPNMAMNDVAVDIFKTEV